MAINQLDYREQFGNALAQAAYMDRIKNMLAPEPASDPVYTAMATHGGPTVSAANALDAYGMNPRDLLAGAIYSEAGGEGPQGQLAVAAVMENRLRNGQWGDTWGDVILAPGQFSAFNGVTGYAGGQGANDLWRRPSDEAYRIADMVLSGQYTDPTGGALNYYNPAAANPAWGNPNWQRIGNHVFGTAG